MPAVPDLENILVTPENTFDWIVRRLGYDTDKGIFPYISNVRRDIAKMKSHEGGFRLTFLTAMSLYSLSKGGEPVPEVNHDWLKKPKEAVSQFIRTYLF